MRPHAPQSRRDSQLLIAHAGVASEERAYSVPVAGGVPLSLLPGAALLNPSTELASGQEVDVRLVAGNIRVRGGVHLESPGALAFIGP